MGIERQVAGTAQGAVATAATRQCPDCGTVVPVHDGFVIWCSACGWNLTGGVVRRERRRRLDRGLERLAATLDEGLARELRSSVSLRPRFTPAKAVAYVVAGVVHLTTVALLVGSIVLAALTFPNTFALIGAVVMAAFAWVVRPRFGKPPSGGVVVLTEMPTLSALLREIADALEAGPVDVLVIDRQFNASWSSVGIRRRRVLTIGLPLFTALGPQERVALLAHEIAHGRNGDARRGMFVGSALNTLEELYAALLPGETLLTHSAMGILDVFSRLLLWILAQPLRCLLWLEFHLLLRDMQRAEYLADGLAAEAAGTEATVALHETLLLDATLAMCIHDAAHRKIGADALLVTIRERVESVPPQERERVRRAAELERARWGATHPPTAMRIKVLEQRAAQEPRVTLDTGTSHKIDLELDRHRAEVATALIDEYRAGLYG